MGNTVQDMTNSDRKYPDPQPNTRRRFLDYLLGTSAVATLGIVYPIFRFMSPPQVIESAENSVVAAKSWRDSAGNSFGGECLRDVPCAPG